MVALLYIVYNVSPAWTYAATMQVFFKKQCGSYLPHCEIDHVRILFTCMYKIVLDQLLVN